MPGNLPARLMEGKMILHELLQVMDSKYDVICGEKRLLDIPDNVRAKLVVKAIRTNNDKIQIFVEENSHIPNDLNQEWVKEHMAKYGTTPNIFDGC
jgi:hypothetical protein